MKNTISNRWINIISAFLKIYNVMFTYMDVIGNSPYVVSNNYIVKDRRRI